MAIDCAIRGGRVVDGTGAAARRADVGIDAGRIVAVGRVDAFARETLDARDCIVTPGFIDPHTHLDAQLCWDPQATPTSLHGVTSVVMGLCGFGVAPCPDGGGDYLLRSLEVVEEIPFESTHKGVDFEWSSWAEFFACVGTKRPGVNVAGYVPHSALRYYAMGDRARTERADARDLERMRSELERALAAGAVGLASSRGPNHNDAYGKPVPSRLADDAELRMLVAACRGRSWQINVQTKFGGDAEALTAEVERYAGWSVEAGVRLSWTPFHAEPGSELWRDVLAHNRSLHERGIEVAPQVAPQPITTVFRFDELSFVALVAGWREAFRGFFELSRAERLERLGAASFRAVLRAAPEDPHERFAPSYAEWMVAHSPSRPDAVGTSVAAAAGAAGQHPSDWLCELVAADGLATLIQVPVANRDREASAQLARDPGTLIGLGDSGAHVMTITNYTYPTVVLSDLVRERGALTLETAVGRMTSHPAAFLGLPDRGVLAPGYRADIAVIDFDALGLGPMQVATDLPGGAPRLFQAARGYRAVLVNGEVTLAADRLTGRRPGELIRCDS